MYLVTLQYFIDINHYKCILAKFSGSVVKEVM